MRITAARHKPISPLVPAQAGTQRKYRNADVAEEPGFPLSRERAEEGANRHKRNMH